MTTFTDRRTPIAILAALILVISAIHLVWDRPGPLYLIPVALAALWLGRRAGVVAGVGCAVLLTLILRLGDVEDGGIITVLVRLGVYAGVGWIVGVLSESQLGLTRELRKREMELQELRTMQEALAPGELPSRPALDLATCYVPAEHGVSGDFYIVAPAPEGATLIAVGDVAGRGLEAAKRAWYVRTLIASSADFSEDPATLLERANRALVEEAGFSGFASRFVTVACAIFHLAGRIDWALAGHDGPIRLDDGQPLEGDGEAGLPLGVADELGCRTSTAPLDPGSGVLLYTDGLTEARRNPNGSGEGLELFGEERMARLVSGFGDRSSAAEVVRRLRREVSNFSGGRLADDLCLIAIRVTG